MITVITPSTHDIGAFEVRRTLPNQARTMVGTFIFVDQFGPAHFDIGRGMDVRPHPHINLATVTYLFEGAIDHRDSLGTLATIRPGACNLMTAGSGIVHSERSPLAERERATGSHMGRIYGMQTWLALPDAAAAGLRKPAAGPARRIAAATGTQVIALNDEQRDAWRQAMQPVWKQFEGVIGADIMKAAQTVNRNSHN